MCILHGFVHVFKIGFAPPTHFLCETSTQHLLAVPGVRINWVRREQREREKKYGGEKSLFFSLLKSLYAVPTVWTPGTGNWIVVLLPSGGTWWRGQRDLVGVRVITKWARGFSQQMFCVVCFYVYAILTSYNNGETAVGGYNPTLFWVISVSCWYLEKLISRSTISIAD